MVLQNIDENLYHFAQRNPLVAPLIDRIRWRYEACLPALWNLMLYTLPTCSELARTAKPDDEIQYRFCPHLPNGESRYAEAFCRIHLAYMCKECSKVHDWRCNRKEI